MTTVKDLDIERYMGKWHEIARYPTLPYEADCDHAVAVYIWNANENKILVENQCFRDRKYIRSRYATAWIPDPSDKGKLKIQFQGLPRDPGPGDYWVHWTDYQNAIVGSPSGQLLWWLSRKPTVKASEVEPMLQKIRTYGYNTDRLMATPGTVTN